ncbi:MAG: serine/threonine protein kinase, partial [Clostridia bacterium]|nr:serine/threonine protein kinase [Clostridia bacterium]
MGFFENRTPEIIKQWNDMTWLVMDRGSFYVCKVVSFEDLELYKKLVEIDSPYIARVYDVTLVQDRLCAVQEYIQGETLEEYLQEKGPLTEQVVCDVTLELLEGLGAMHDRGIIHRDLTPKNIIVTGDDHIKVIDFGISRVEKAGASTDTEFLGTAGFAAPEQYGFRQTSPRTDIYAVGVLMNYMLTLKIPNEELVEGTLRPIIEKCTRMDEADRYQSVEALQAVLSAMQPNPLKQARPQTGNWLPGFRHGVLWHKVIAGIYYFFALTMLLVGA